MKNTFLTLAAVAVLSAGAAPQLAQAQTSAVTNAILNQRQGLLDKARVDIDKAIYHEKTSGKAKTWFTRGEIYEQMLDNPIYSKGLQPGEGVQKAFESYAKALELDGPAGEYGKQVKPKLDNMYARAFNAGVESYNAKNYDQALASYKLAAQINAKDTTAVLYSAYALEAKQDAAGAKTYYNQLLGMGYRSAQLYNRLLQIARSEKNDAEARKVLTAALAAYPTNKTFLIEDLNLSMGAGGNATAAIEKLNKAIAADPTNSNLYEVRGSLNDQLKKSDLAQADYQKAVDLDDKNYNAHFNLGVNYFNRGVEILNRTRKMDLKTYAAQGKKLEIEGKRLVEKAIPHFEKTIELQPNDQAALTSLQKAYVNAGRPADAERIRARLDALKK